MLTNQLRELEEDGIVIRRAFAENPPRVEYSLSDFGETLRPIIDSMWHWGKTFIASLPAEKKQPQVR